MLTLYLVAHQQSQYQPTQLQVQNWMMAVEQSHIARVINNQNSADMISDSRASHDLVPSHGMVNLFDQNAKDALLPAELTFEALQIHWAPEVTFLPLQEVDLEIECRQCGDAFKLDLFYKNLQKLDFVPFSQLQMWCESCQMEIKRKGWSFNQTVAFAKFWIQIEECGSTRLNPVLLKAWGELLGCKLDIVVEQRDEVWTAWDHEIDDGGSMAYESIGIKPSRMFNKKKRSSKKRSKNKKNTYW